MIHEILEKSGISVGSVTSINAKIKDEELDTGLHVTNPSPIALNSFLKKMVDKKCEYAILEVTSHGLDQKRTAGIKFDIGVLTNIKHEHLDYHKTFQAYKQAKAKLFSDINTVVLNKDDKESFEFIKSITDSEVNIITYSLNSNSDYLIINIKTDRKMSFSIKEGNQNHKIETEFLGDFNALNLAAAIAVARNEGLDWDNITSAIKTIKSPLGRMEKIANDKSLNIYIDFAHTPDSLEKVLQFLKKKYPQGKLISVFGCASERDVLKRPMMGKISTQLAEVSIFTAEDPRSEDINKIINEMAAGVDKNLAIEGDLDSPEYKNTHLYYKFPQRGDAISFAINKVAQSGDTIVICGKGHEKSMAYYGIEYPWSDHKAIELALKGKSYKIAYEK